MEELHMSYNSARIAGTLPQMIHIGIQLIRLSLRSKASIDVQIQKPISLPSQLRSIQLKHWLATVHTHVEGDVVDTAEGAEGMHTSGLPPEILHNRQRKYNRQLKGIPYMFNQADIEMVVYERLRSLKVDITDPNEILRREVEQNSHSSFTDHIEQAPPPRKFSTPNFVLYKGDTNPKIHLKH